MGSPVTHATGMLGAVLAPMELGEDIHLIDRWDPSARPRRHARGRHRRRHRRVGVPREHARPSGLHARARARMRRVGLGGAPVPLALAERAAVARHRDHPRLRLDRAPVDHRLHLRRPGRQAARAPTAAPLPGVEIRLLDDDGVAVAAGEPGEIWSRGPDLCVGYTDPALDARRLRRRRLVPHRRHGRARRRRLPHDHRPPQRRDHPRRREHLGGRDRGGDRGTARRSPRSRSSRRPTRGSASTCARSSGSRPASPSIDARARSPRDLERVGLARQKWPEELRVVDDFPRTATGKIRKVDLREEPPPRPRGRHPG